MVSSVHPEEKKEEEAAGTIPPRAHGSVANRKGSGVFQGALEGAALVVLGEDLDGTAGGNLANGKAPLASAFMRKNSTYFEKFTSKSDLGELGPVYRNVYAEMIRIFHTGPIVAFIVLIFLVQIIMAIACLGVGLPGNTYFNGMGVFLGTYGAMSSTWVEGVHPGCFRPNSFSFWVTGLAYMFFYGTVYWFKYEDYVAPPEDDEVLEDYNYPAQPWVIIWDAVMKVGCTIIIANTIMFQGHKDASQKVSFGVGLWSIFTAG